MEELQVAKEAAREAGKVLMTYFRSGLRMAYKAECNPVSAADFAAQAKIYEIIAKSFPEHSIMSEEGLDQQRDGEHLWILDPLDGTTNFLHGIDQFAVSIAYYRNGKPQVGVVHMPARDEWFVATAGGGAFHNGEKVAVSDCSEFLQALIGFGFYYDAVR